MDEQPRKTTACVRTHCKLSIVSSDIEASKMSEILSIEPTKISVKGDLYKEIIEVNNHAFYLSTEGVVFSKEPNEHLDWLLDKLNTKTVEIDRLKNDGCLFAITCAWWSQYGGGGPVLEPKQMRGLADLDIPIGWLIWFNVDE